MPSFPWISCDDQLKGLCGALHEHTKNYVFVFILSVLFTYVVPIIMILAIFLISGVSFSITDMLILFSPAMPGLASILHTSSILAVMVTGAIVTGIDIMYLVYMARQLGVFVAMPIAVDAIKWVIVLFFHPFTFIAMALSLIPFMPIAVGTHYAIALMGSGMTLER